MNRFYITAFLCLFGFGVLAHPWKPAHYIIVDTDCGFDDYRAICMLLAAPDIRVLGIVASNGVLDAKTGYGKVNSLLGDLHHEGILTGINYAGADPKNCFHADNFSWGKDTESVNNVLSAKQLVEDILGNIKEPVDYVCLGSLGTVKQLYPESALFRENIRSIIWSSDFPGDKNDFNNKLDEEAFQFVNEKAGMPLKIISAGEAPFSYDTLIIDKIGDIGTPYAEKISSSFGISRSPFARFFFDERIPVFLARNDLFEVDTLHQFIHFQMLQADKAKIEDCIIRLAAGYQGNQNQVLSGFPLDTTFYQADIRQIMDVTIKKYGLEEWIAGVMANELHRHLGVYAIIGTKMGIRAREYFGSGVDEMKIISYAGIVPPFSCMNDGLQVSTGATLGHGLIDIARDSVILPEAEFVYMGRTIRVCLKEKYREKIKREISTYRIVYGLSSDMYWEMVRNAALNYWMNWNRYEIFTIKI
jgi:pyrimidine-specific ribonucleoside hydrolase